MLELVWQQDATASLFTRDSDGTVSAARSLDVHELIRLAETPPADAGGSALAVFSVVELAQRSVTEGLVHPYLEHVGGSWHAFWGATLDESVQAALDRIAAALPEAAATAFDGDRDETVRDLYPVLVDQIARDRLQAGRVRLGASLRNGRPTAVELFLDGLSAAEPELPRHAGYAALNRRLSRWLDDGLGRRSSAPWKLGLHLDERGTALVLELWLHAEDDPTLGLPARLLHEEGDEVFTFLRASDPHRDLARQLTEIEPLLAEHGIRFDQATPAEAELDGDEVQLFLREAMPLLEARGVPVLLPGAWLGSPSKLRVNLTATSSGLPRPFERPPLDGLARDVRLEARPRRRRPQRAGARRPRRGERAVRPRRRSLARAAPVRRREGAALSRAPPHAVPGSSSSSARSVGLETDEAGLELGEVSLDAPLADLLQDGDHRFRPLPTPASMQFALFPFQERGHGWLRMLGDLGVGGILADDMGLGKTVQAIAMLASEREELGPGVLGPTLVVCPMSVVKQWGAEIARFAPSLRVHSHHGSLRLAGTALAEAALASDVVITSYDIATRDVDFLAAIPWDRLLLDEAQDVKNPNTKRARALRRLPARRRLAMTGTPIENRLSELWALMDIVNPGLLGSREWFERAFARPIETHSHDGALERLRSIVQPFILRRAKDAPEVELELPPITVTKDYCRLTVEQASLYRATVDHWLPRIEAHGDRFGRRGAVLAMLSHLKQVCNHPEMLVATGQPLDGRSGKLERLLELLEQVPEGDKALVFTQYPGFDRLVPHLEERLGTQRRLLSRPAQRAASASTCSRSSRPRTGRRCS